MILTFAINKGLFKLSTNKNNNLTKSVIFLVQYIVPKIFRSFQLLIHSHPQPIRQSHYLQQEKPSFINESKQNI